MRAFLPLLAVAVAIGGFSDAAGQEMQIGIIDFYGLRQVPAAQGREALAFKEGDSISYPAVEPLPTVAESEIRLSKLAGVERAHAYLVRCDDGRVIVYVGVQERGAAIRRLRSEPQGKARLAGDLIEAGHEFSKAFMLATQRGNFVEDRSQGHALFSDPATRAIQERFVTYAKRDLAQLRVVLRSSSDAHQRALAAQVLAYATDKQAVVNDLVYGMTDPADQGRNNAMRALVVFSEMAPVTGRATLRIPHQPFITFLNSPVWTDRNKASAALQTLSAGRDASLLTRLRDALPPLAEMARWKSEGHAKPAFKILARIGGYTDDAAEAAWERSERELVISAALRGQ